MSKPATKPAWIPDDDPAKIIAPSESKQNTGWLSGEKPVYQFFNWFFNIVSKWIAYLEEITDEVPIANGGTGATTAADALINLGLPPADEIYDVAHYGKFDDRGGMLLVDGTGGRVLRFARLRVEDGTGAGTIKCTLVDIFNGDDLSVTDNIAKGGTSIFFYLAADGLSLKILYAGVTGGPVIYAQVGQIEEIDGNIGAEETFVNAVELSGDIRLIVRVGSTAQDLSTWVDAHEFTVSLMYITTL